MISEVIIWSERIIALGMLLQTLELLSLRKEVSEQGVWSWRILRQDHFGVLGVLFGYFLEYKPFIAMLGLRLLASSLLLAGYFQTTCLLLLLVSSYLISLRWRGSFNGGSDNMSFVVLACLSFSRLFPSSQLACVLLIAVQSMMSYFIAGLVKILNSKWRSGEALSEFTSIPTYSPPAKLKALLANPKFAFCAAWLIMGFELLFPVCLLSVEICQTLLLAAFTFHVFNFWAFGLNRFVFAWSATYPAVLFLSVRLSASGLGY